MMPTDQFARALGYLAADIAAVVDRMPTHQSFLDAHRPAPSGGRTADDPGRIACADKRLPNVR
jgi:hypothetical protein